jgi:CBS domain-containing protein
MERNRETVADLMTHGVVAVGRDAGFRETAGTLRTWRVNALPVLAGDGRVIGVVSEADLLTAQTREDEDTDGPGEPELTAGRLMSAPAITVHPDAPAQEAARTMARAHLKCLPVVDDEGMLVGVISRSDLLKSYLRSDEDLAARVRFEILSVLRADAATAVRVTADEGRITLSGAAEDQELVSVLERVVRGVPGVVDVSAELSVGIPVQDGRPDGALLDYLRTAAAIAQPAAEPDPSARRSTAPATRGRDARGNQGATH